MVTAQFVFSGYLLVVGDFENFAPFIITTFGANGMRQAHGTAVGAGGQIAGFQSVVGAAAITATFGNFSFWQRGHESFSLIQASGFLPDVIFLNKPADYSGVASERQVVFCFVFERGLPTRIDFPLTTYNLPHRTM